MLTVLDRVACFDRPQLGALTGTVQTLHLRFQFEVTITPEPKVFEHRLIAHLLDSSGQPTKVDVRARDKMIHLAYDFDEYRATGVTDLKYEITMEQTIHQPDAVGDWDTQVINVRNDDEVVEDSGMSKTSISIFPGGVSVNIAPHAHPKQYARKLSFSAMTKRTKADGQTDLNLTSFVVDPIIIIAPKRP